MLVNVDADLAEGPCVCRLAQCVAKSAARARRLTRCAPYASIRLCCEIRAAPVTPSSDSHEEHSAIGEAALGRGRLAHFTWTQLDSLKEASSTAAPTSGECHTVARAHGIPIEPTHLDAVQSQLQHKATVRLQREQDGVHAISRVVDVVWSVAATFRGDQTNREGPRVDRARQPVVDRDPINVAGRERSTALLAHRSRRWNNGHRSGGQATLRIRDAPPHREACPCLDCERDVQRLRMCNGLDCGPHLDDQRFDERCRALALAQGREDEADRQ
eukprot:6685248-Prymnesium_polylepis.1